MTSRESSEEDFSDADEMASPVIISSGVRPPAELNLKTGDPLEKLKNFERMFEFYSKASKLDRETHELQVATLMSTMGADTVSYYFSLDEPAVPEGEVETVKLVLNHLRANLKVGKGSMFNRYQFHKINQSDGQTVHEYLDTLRKLLDKCNYRECKSVEELIKQLLRDKLTFGIKHHGIRKTIFDKDGIEKNPLSLDAVIQMCVVGESTVDQMQQMTTTNEVLVLNKRNRYEKIQKCSYCGRSHEAKRSKCPAVGHKCLKCGKFDHYATVCRGERNVKRTERVKALDCREESGSSDESEAAIKKICFKENGIITALLDFKVNKQLVSTKCQLDTGAMTNVIGIDCFEMLTGSKRMLKPSGVKLSGFSGEEIKVLGQIKLKCIVNQKTFELKFQVVDQSHIPLISAEDCVNHMVLSWSYHM